VRLVLLAGGERVMPTWEVRCVDCLDLKYPTLPERPVAYRCALCRMVTPQKRATRRAGQQKGAETRRQRAISGATDGRGRTVAGDPATLPLP
jgi:hypothetical protein